MFCNNCGAPVVEGNAFCTGCGRKVEREDCFCTNCGGALEAGDLFCGHCGVRLERDTEDKSRLVLVEGESSRGVDSFYMGKFPVTQREWTALMDGNPSSSLGDDLPVDNVSWYDAVDYCNRRSAAEGLEACYIVSGGDVTCRWQANGYRLPTELEWEYAASGGQHHQKYRFSGGDNIDEVAWHGGNSDGHTHAVGGKKPNALGLYDMSGNVAEWCWNVAGVYSNMRRFKGGSVLSAVEIKGSGCMDANARGKAHGLRVVRLCGRAKG